MPTVLTEVEAKELAKKYGIPVPRGGLAKNVDEALKIAEEIGYPVVLKIVSPDILHKTDVGGVKVGISSPEELKKAFEEIMENVKKNKPDAKIVGILVEEMIPGGYEVIIGGKYDETFKHVIMFGGVGGIFVELFKDVSFRLAPIDEKEAERMMKETIGYKVLKGFRGIKGDIEALKKMIANVSEMLVKEDILELDLNPVKVFPDRVVALDVKIIKRRFFNESYSVNLEESKVPY